MLIIKQMYNKQFVKNPGPLAATEIILTWHGRNHDQKGGSPRVRPFHCTSVRLTPAITPNAGDSSA